MQIYVFMTVSNYQNFDPKIPIAQEISSQTKPKNSKIMEFLGLFGKNFRLFGFLGQFRYFLGLVIGFDSVHGFGNFGSALDFWVLFGMGFLGIWPEAMMLFD
jgi:hypothetical protein